MKKWLGFIIVLAVLLIPMPVMAIGVSPYTVSVDVTANSYTELVFNVTGCSSVDLSFEGIPLVVEPSHAFVVDGKITVRILGSLLVPSGTYSGYLVMLESGQQVGTGVKINLTVNYTNNQSVVLTTTVLNTGGGYSGGGYWAPWPPTPPTFPSPTVPPAVVPPVPVLEPAPEYVPEPTPVPVPTPVEGLWDFIKNNLWLSIFPLLVILGFLILYQRRCVR